MRANITTSEPLDAAAIKRFCNQHFTAALSMHMAHGGHSTTCILPMGASRSFTVNIGGDRCVSVSDDDEARARRFCAALVARFGGSIETR